MYVEVCWIGFDVLFHHNNISLLFLLPQISIPVFCVDVGLLDKVRSRNLTKTLVCLLFFNGRLWYDWMVLCWNRSSIAMLMDYSSTSSFLSHLTITTSPSPFLDWQEIGQKLSKFSLLLPPHHLLMLLLRWSTTMLMVMVMMEVRWGNPLRTWWTSLD